MTPETHPIEKVQVMAYLDGELSSNDAKRITAHLEECAECRELAKDLRGVSSQLLSWGIEPASKRLDKTVMAVLTNREVRPRANEKLTVHDAWKRILQSRWTWATAGLVAVVACFFAVSPALFEVHKVAIAPFRSQEAVAITRQSAGMGNQIDKAVTELGGGGGGEESKISTGPMIARTASLKISVKDFPSARASVSGIVAAHKGYVASLSISSQTGAAQSLNAKLAIPAAEYDAALTDLRRLGRVEQEQQGGEEVTAQVVDLDARLKNARETETQVANILKTRTGKIGDVLEVEQEMARVRGDIERMEAEQKQLRGRIAFASVDVTLTEEYQAQLGDNPSVAGRQIRNALVDGYRAAADGVLSVFVFFLNVGPSLLLWALILFLPARWAWRRWRKSRAIGIGGV
jgi:Domain of unknown function (DUF4349)/Putative zinc-finger